VLVTRAQASKAQDAFAENFENYIDGKISKEQFSENAIPIKENMKRLEVEEREQREVLKTKDLSKEVVEALVKRIVVGVEHAYTVEYKFYFGE
jgi:elongation factor P--beta-lysine ligase